MPKQIQLTNEEQSYLEEFRRRIFSLIPEEYFVEELHQNTLGHIKIAILREAVGPFICRSTDSEATITYRMEERREVVEVPPRKFKSREKLLGLKICRELEVVDSEIRYNLIRKPEQLANPNSVLFGDSVTQEAEAAGLRSRALYDWAYSIRDVSQITDDLQHNALSESGTMWDEERGRFRQSLFTVQYVLPETFFSHFVTVDDITPELLAHLLYCIQKENSYGAQTTTNTGNFINHIIAISYSKFEPPLNSFVFSRDYEVNEQDESKKVTFENVKSKLIEQVRSFYGTSLLLPQDKLSELLNYLEQLWHPDQKLTLQAIYKKAFLDAQAYTKWLKILK